MKRLLAVALATFAGACAPAPSSTYTPTAYSAPAPKAPEIEAGEPYKLSSQQQQVVRSGVTKSLKDPESARFGEMFASKDSKGAITVCGYVNAKNSYGGYVGMSPYLGVLGKSEFAVVELSATDSKRASIGTVCRASGIPNIG